MLALTVEGILSVVFSVFFSCVSIYYILQYRKRDSFEGLIVSILFLSLTIALFYALIIHSPRSREIYVYNSTNLAEVRTEPIYEYNPYSNLLIIPLVLWTFAFLLYLFLFIVGKIGEIGYIELR